ncbi:MAG: DNA-formamidopyrimidine glycosylase family protein, partial [bacterium]
MPELPEVQTIVNGLEPYILQKEIDRIIQYRQGTINTSCQGIVFGRVSSLERRGKYIIIKTSKAVTIIIHLGMTGKLIYKP